MKFSSVAMAALAASVEAMPRAEKIDALAFGPQQLKATSAPKAVAMSTLKQKKLDHFAAQEAAGVYAKDTYKNSGPKKCNKKGKAGEYLCNNVDLKTFIRHQDLGATVLSGNDIWGWTSAEGREFGIVGQADGTAFVEVKADGTLVYIGRLPTQTVPSTWRDMKVIGDYVYIGSEAEGHGMQIFDLNKLLDLDPASPKTFSLDSLTAHFDGFGSSHNIVAHEETNMIYAVGTATNLDCRGGLWMIDVSNPARPQDMGCVSDDGYVHDAQCVIYKGPDANYYNQEICFNYNEDALTIVDVTRKSMPETISRTTYNGATYTHQGWLANDAMTHLLLDDELDEQEMTGPAADQRTTTYIVDITDLSYPVFTGVYKSPQRSIDHNQYVVGDLTYQANYGSGLRIVNVTSLSYDPSSASFQEVGYFDCRPEDDAEGGLATFDGSWGVYPYFKSGYILLNSIERGVFSLKYNP